MSHLTTLAPLEPSYGYGRRLMYRTTVVRASSGKTYRNSLWEYPLHAFSLPLNNRAQSELEQIEEYFHAAAGAGHTFDFLDRSEDRTCSLSDDPADDDVILGTAAASQTDFQLIKTYASGGRTQVRKITRPIASSVLIAKDGAPQTVTTHYTIEAGGIIRFNSGLSGGEVITAGFRFYVPVAFASDDVDITIHNYSGGFIGDSAIQLLEVRE